VFVGVARVALYLHGNASLKGKRSIVRRVVERTKNKFNAAVAEVSDNDSLQRAVLGAAAVGNSAAHVDSMLGHICAFIEHLGVAAVVSRETEVIPLGGDIGGENTAFPGPSAAPLCYDDDGDSEDDDGEEL
jgi:uncharacterized protein